MDYKKLNNGYFIKFNKNSDFLSEFIEFSKKNQLKFSFLNGLGALKDIELGYFDIQNKEYSKKEFKGDYELLSLNGNVSMINNDYSIHVHAQISDNEFKVYGGHLFRATVAVTLEMFVFESDTILKRSKDPFFNLNLLNL